MPSLAVIVVTYKTKDLLRAFLFSVQQELPDLPVEQSRIVVVDNASQDGTREMVAQEFPAVLYLENSQNLGPAKAFNLGLQAVLPQSDYVVLANSDVVVHRGTLSRMLTFLLEHPQVDGCCGRLFNADGTPQFSKTQIFTLRKTRHDRPGWASFPGTTFALFRASCFMKIGGFDEAFYFYNEDLEWAERARRYGLRFYYLPDAGATHYGGQGRDQNISRIREELYWANLYYFRRYYPWLEGAVYYSQRLLLWWEGQKPRANREVIQKAIQKLDQEYRSPRQPLIPHF